MAKNNLKEAMAQMSSEEKQELATAVLEYNAAKQNGADIQTVYNKLRDVLKSIETKYNVTIFVPIVPEAKLIDTIANKVSEKMNEQPEQNGAPVAKPAAPAPVVASAPPVGSNYSKNFTSLTEANAWLSQQQNLTVNNLQVNTSRVGLDIEKIWLEYRTEAANVCHRYQITEKMKHRFFAGTRHETFRRKWQEKNPQFTYIASTKHKWGFSLIGGSLGFFRYIKEKYVILYSLKN